MPTATYLRHRRRLVKWMDSKRAEADRLTNQSVITAEDRKRAKSLRLSATHDEKILARIDGYVGYVPS